MYKRNIILLDTGFMGSIIGAWIKPARVEKSSLSNPTFFTERSIVAKSVSTNTAQDLSGLFISWLRRTQQVLRRGKSLGIREVENRILIKIQAIGTLARTVSD